MTATASVLQRDEEVLPEEEVDLDHRMAHRVGAEEDNRDEVPVAFDLGALPELGGVLNGERVNLEHVAQQGQCPLAGVVQVQPENFVAGQRLLDVGRFEVVVGGPVDADQVAVHAVHGLRPCR